MNSWLWPADSQRRGSVLLPHPFQNRGAYQYRLTFCLTLPAPSAPSPRGSPLTSLTSSAGLNRGSCWITGSFGKLGRKNSCCVSNQFSLIVPKHFWCIFSLVQTTVGFLLGSVKSCRGPRPPSSCVLWMPPRSTTTQTDFHLRTSCRTPYHHLKFLRIFLSETIQASSPLDWERGDNNDNEVGRWQGWGGPGRRGHTCRGSATFPLSTPSFN